MSIVDTIWKYKYPLLIGAVSCGISLILGLSIACIVGGISLINHYTNNKYLDITQFEPVLWGEKELFRFQSSGDIISQIMRGLYPFYSDMSELKQKKWCKLIRFMLSQINDRDDLYSDKPIDKSYYPHIADQLGVDLYILDECGIKNEDNPIELRKGRKAIILLRNGLEYYLIGKLFSTDSVQGCFTPDDPLILYINNKLILNVYH